jgi:hypothetical protein
MLAKDLSSERTLAVIDVVAQQRGVGRDKLWASAPALSYLHTSARVPTFHPLFDMIGLTWLAIFSRRGRASSERGRFGRCSNLLTSDILNEPLLKEC